MEKRLTKRQIQAIETKEKIYRTAIDMLEENDYSNIRIEDICEKAGVSIGTYYNYFNSKNDILNIMYKKADEHFENIVKSQIIDCNAIEGIKQYFYHYAQYNYNSGLTTIKLLYNPDNEYFINKERSMYIILKNIIIKGQDNNNISIEDDADYITSFLFITARGLVYDWCLHNGNYDLHTSMNDYIHRIIELFIN